MKNIHHVFDYLALLFGIRTANNTEGFVPGQSWARTKLLPLLKLIFVLVAGVLVLFVLTSLLTQNYFNERNTRQGLEEISAQLVKHRQRQQSLPPTLPDFAGLDPLKRDLTFDSWGTPILYQPNSAGHSFTLTSAGKDLRFNSSDDLVYTAPAQ